MRKIRSFITIISLLIAAIAFILKRIEKTLQLKFIFTITFRQYYQFMHINALLNQKSFILKESFLNAKRNLSLQSFSFFPEKTKLKLDINGLRAKKRLIFEDKEQRYFDSLKYETQLKKTFLRKVLFPLSAYPELTELVEKSKNTSVSDTEILQTLDDILNNNPELAILICQKALKYIHIKSFKSEDVQKDIGKILYNFLPIPMLITFLIKKKLPFFFDAAFQYGNYYNHNFFNSLTTIFTNTFAKNYSLKEYSFSALQHLWFHFFPNEQLFSKKPTKRKLEHLILNEKIGEYSSYVTLQLAQKFYTYLKKFTDDELNEITKNYALTKDSKAFKLALFTLLSEKQNEEFFFEQLFTYEKSNIDFMLYKAKNYNLSILSFAYFSHLANSSHDFICSIHEAFKINDRYFRLKNLISFKEVDIFSSAFSLDKTDSFKIQALIQVEKRVKENTGLPLETVNAKLDKHNFLIRRDYQNIFTYQGNSYSTGIFLCLLQEFNDIDFSTLKTFFSNIRKMLKGEIEIDQDLVNGYDFFEAKINNFMIKEQNIPSAFKEKELLPYYQASLNKIKPYFSTHLNDETLLAIFAQAFDKVQFTRLQNLIVKKEKLLRSLGKK